MIQVFVNRTKREMRVISDDSDEFELAFASLRINLHADVEVAMTPSQYKAMMEGQDKVDP